MRTVIGLRILIVNCVAIGLTLAAHLLGGRNADATEFWGAIFGLCAGLLPWLWCHYGHEDYLDPASMRKAVTVPLAFAVSGFVGWAAGVNQLRWTVANEIWAVAFIPGLVAFIVTLGFIAWEACQFFKVWGEQEPR